MQWTGRYFRCWRPTCGAVNFAFGVGAIVGPVAGFMQISLLSCIGALVSQGLQSSKMALPEGRKAALARADASR